MAITGLMKAAKNEYKRQFPACEFCLDVGIWKDADSVRYLRPIEKQEDGTDFNNMISLCEQCNGIFNAMRANKKKNKPNTFYEFPVIGNVKQYIKKHPEIIPEE